MAGALIQPQDAQKPAYEKRHQRGRQKPRKAARPEGEDGERGGADAQGVEVDAGQRLGERADCAHEAARRGRRAEKGQGLDRQNDDADAGHEARDDHMGRVDHEAPGAQRAQKHLQQAAQNDDAQRLGEVRRVGRDDDRHGDGHRRRGAGDDGSPAAEERREKTERYRAIEARRRAQARRHAERKREGQRHHRRGETAEDSLREAS